MDENYLNAMKPPAVTSHPAGEAIAVIARFILLDGSEEWRPATAVRWTDSAVLVVIRGGNGGPTGRSTPG